MALLGVACGGSEEAPATERSAPLEAEDAPETSHAFTIQQAESSADFVMEAPLENIHGRVPASVVGTLNLELDDLTQSRGLIRVDLFQLDVWQQKRETADAAFGEEVRNDTQNAHVKNWFEIGDDAPAETRELNRWVEFSVARVSDVSEANVMTMSGDERVVQLTVHGPLRVHGRTVEKSARLELTFSYDGDNPAALSVRTLEPISVGLDEYDVRPRTAFGTLAQRTLSALGEKVAEAAPVTLDVRATPAE